MADHLVTLEQIVAARGAVDGQVHRTPILTSETAARMIERSTGVRIADGRLYLKAEHLQKTGSFKVRGALARLAALTPAERERGVITMSAGNAAQAYAWAGARAGVRVAVVMPAAATRSKVEACIAYGAEVVLHGAHTGETFDWMERQRVERDLVFVHPFDQPEVIAGAGSVGLEMIEDLPELDVAVMGIGGGGLISGVSCVMKERRPGSRVYGIEPEKANSMALALAANEIVRIQPASVADGLGAPFAGEWTLAMTRRYVDDVVLLDDPTILAGLRFSLERLKQVVEPAGTAALAALLFGRIPLRDGDRVAVVLSGGNVEVARLGELVAGAAELPG